MANTRTLRIDYIVITPGVVGGKPRIAGTGLSVSFIADLHARQRATVEQIGEQFGLTPAQIHAALAYYYDHKSEMDALPSDGDAGERGGASTPQTDHEITVSEAAVKFHISPQAVREAIAKGWLPARKSGGVWLIRWEDARRRWGRKG